MDEINWICGSFLRSFYGGFEDGWRWLEKIIY